MKTKPIDYTGCHHEIAECLKRGEAVLCRVKDNNDTVWTNEYVIGYRKNGDFHYWTIDSVYMLSEPVKTVTKVKKASEIVKWLEDHGYYVENGHWSHLSNKAFNRCMFQYCGKEPNMNYTWHHEWIEEVEE